MQPLFLYARRLLLLLGCACALMGTGCKGVAGLNQHIESVNAEYKLLEDEVYVLQSQKEELQSEVHYLKKQLEDAKKGTLGSGGGGIFRRRNSPASDGGIDATDPSMSPPVIEEGDSVSPDEVTPMPRGAGADSGRRPNWSPTPSQNTPPASRVPGRLSHTTQMPPLTLPERYEDKSLPVKPKPTPAEEFPTPTEAELPPPANSPTKSPASRAPELIDEKVSQLYLHPVYTGIAKLEQQGAEGLRVLIEPQNRQGQFVPRPGRVTIVALDPTREGDSARLARWEFEASAVSHMLTTSGAKRGIYLQLPWPGQPPAGDQLQLFVRFQQGDAPPLEVERELATHLNAPTLERWVRRAPKPLEEQAIAEANTPKNVPTTDVIHDGAVATVSAEEPIESTDRTTKRPRAWSSTR